MIIITELNCSLIYNTDGNLKTDIDCIYAYISDISYEYEKNVHTNYLTPYCRRLSFNDLVVEVEGNTENVITFENLRFQNMTSEDLFQWSNSIDIIEDYEIYLTTNSPDLSQRNFYNCSIFWFGSRCQYTFNLNQTIESFGDFVISSFSRRKTIKSSQIVFTCYPHLFGCYRGPEPMCLDWREICDGKIDCIGDYFGIDETNCEQLEMIECEDDEYRCHNGGQCIPYEFFHDGFTNKDCLDGTDEKLHRIYNPLVINENYFCMISILFMCEEKSCNSPNLFSCGDGQCIYFRMLNPDVKNTYCHGTRRDTVFDETIDNISTYLPLSCYTSLFRQFEFDYFIKNITHHHVDWFKSNNCSITPIPFSVQPILVYFSLHRSKQTLINNSEQIILSKPICNNLQEYLRLSKVTFQLITLYCYQSRSMIRGNYRSLLYWNNLAMRLNVAYFFLNNQTRFLSHSFLHFCSLSHQYISKYLLFDNIIDCYYGDDEFPVHCLLNDTMKHTNECKVLCAVILGTTNEQCTDQFRDDLYSINYKRRVYSRICIGISRSNEVNDNYLDNTNCDLWPCLTPYTRCDGIFQCLNGIDELNCSNNSICQENEFKCENYQGNYNEIICTPYEYIYEKQINCSFESEYLSTRRQIFYLNNSLSINSNEYISWKVQRSLTMSDICINYHQFGASQVEILRSTYPSIQLIDMNNNRRMCDLNELNSIEMRDYYFRYASQFNLGYLPLAQNHFVQREYIDRKSKEDFILNDKYQYIEYCHRGILIYESESKIKTCLCPPNYFGDRCQWQNQRISLTLQFQKLFSIEQIENLIFEILIYLIDDQTQTIQNFIKILYIPSQDCSKKHNRYLLYPTKPKPINQTYSIRIDIYNKITLDYYASWYLPISFVFLPVSRISKILYIPSNTSHLTRNCSLDCGIHGQCYNYINSDRSFCHCYENYSGEFCQIKGQCSCSSDSICLNSSICLCPLNKFGSKCYLKHRSCQPKNPCQNRGQCVPVDDRIHSNDFVCLCLGNYFGTKCEFNSTQIQVHFQQTDIPRIIFAHFISVFDGQKPHEQITKFQKIPFNQNSITLFTQEIFHILFIEYLDGSIYLSVLREQSIPSEQISVHIHSDFKCQSINHLLNSTILSLNHSHRVKFYQLPCHMNPKLKCFYDEMYVCICDRDRFSNCFNFDFNTKQNSQCKKSNLCQNNGTCFPDRTNCPQSIICNCQKCFYGSRCELTTQSFSLSLDNIFGYHIKPSVSFFQQTLPVQITTLFTIVMFIFGFISGFLSIYTFKQKSIISFGCGIYLLTNSILSLFTISLFTIKYFQLICFQMNLITDEMFIYSSCLITDVLLKILLSSNDWLNACIAIERAVTAIHGVAFNNRKSRYIAKRIIPIVFILISFSYVHDPLSRRLYDDKDEQKRLCIAHYSSTLSVYDKFISIFHFSIPFIINMICAVIIIVKVIRTRLKLKNNASRNIIFRKEIQRHKHLIISPLILILLNIPRLIITFLSACMESPSNPWLFLVGYYVSFISPLMIFFVFILPSENYKAEFLRIMKKKRFITCCK